MQANGAKLVVDCLIQHGVSYVFGIPGAKVDSIFEALREAESSIKLIVCRHEQNAAFMAAMVGRLTGKPGVVIVTSGPGVTNLATGLLTATTEGDPVIAIGANVSRDMRLKRTHQSLDNAAVMAPVCKKSVEVLDVHNIAETIESAFRESTFAYGGAYFISIPQDVLLQEASHLSPLFVPDIEIGAADKVKIEQAAALINQAKQPVILLGMQASQPLNCSAIRAMLSKTSLPVVSTFQAAGVIPQELLHCFAGRLGLFNNQPGDELLRNADVIFSIGYNPVEYDPEYWCLSYKKIIHLDTVPAEIHNCYLPHIELIGDIAKSLNALTQALKPQDFVSQTHHFEQIQQSLFETIKRGAEKKGALIHPLRFIDDLHKIIDENTTIISDIGSHYIWLARYLYIHQPRQLLFSNGQQTLGVALPWAIATRLVRPHHKIISISGDGGFLFSSMELETAVREGCCFVHCVWRDGSYNMVKEQEMMKYQHESGVALGRVNLVHYAASFGAIGYEVNDSDDLLPTLQKALLQKVPVLIDIAIDYSDNPELFKSLHQDVGN